MPQKGLVMHHCRFDGFWQVGVHADCSSGLSLVDELALFVPTNLDF